MGAPLAPTVEAFSGRLRPMNAARARKVLQTVVRVNGGEFMPRHELIESRVRDGATIETREGKRALVRPNGVYLLENSITGTGIDYAEFLIAEAGQ